MNAHNPSPRRQGGADAIVGELDYTQQLLRELRDMAQARQDDMLGYLLEMAYVHCSDELRSLHQQRAGSRD